MGYFRELPNLQYQSPFSSRISSSTYVVAKNIFRRMKIRDDLKNVFSVFNKYEIDDGDRPDTVARDLYGKSTLDYVVLITAQIVNVRDQWPLSSKDLYDFIVSKYGLTIINDVRHYETKEIKNNRGVVVMQEGKIVDQNFTFKYSDVVGTKFKKDSSGNDELDNQGNKIVIDNIRMVEISGSKLVRGVTYYEHEVRVNENKRLINVLRPEYLQQFLNDIKNEMTYDRSSQFINNDLIKTENTRITIS
tara:strand:+ start:443 stop:1183 length:741 start_codon:yes stop_codon:yes gene_type:complete